MGCEAKLIASLCIYFDSKCVCLYSCFNKYIMRNAAYLCMMDNSLCNLSSFLIFLDESFC